MNTHHFQPGDRVRVAELAPDLGVAAGSVGTVQEPLYDGSEYVRVTFSPRNNNVPCLPHELEPA